MANVTPIDSAAIQTRLIVDAVKESVVELKSDVKAIKGYRHTDLLLHIGAFAAGITLVVGMMVAAYFKLDDKIHGVSITTIKTDQKLEDLLQRIPPVQTPAPRK
jgi:hypothetical protein